MNKTVLITGCSSGFGLVTAVHLAEKGYTVFATMRDLDKKENLLSEAAEKNLSIHLLPLDVTDPVSIKNCADQIIKTHQKIDILVNNAGYVIGGFFEDLTQEEIRAQMETNFFGVQNVCREVIPYMRRACGGKIINISSIAGRYALPGMGAYNASKWALEGFSESLYYEMKLFNIHVSVIEPGLYKTKIFSENRRYAKNLENPESPYYAFSKMYRDKVQENIRLNRKDPKEIAVLIEKIIHSNNPPFRTVCDVRGKFLLSLRQFLPFSVFSRMVQRALWM